VRARARIIDGNMAVADVAVVAPVHCCGIPTYVTR